MELDTLLGGKTDCECGRAHICGIKHIKIGEGALGALPGLLKAFTRVAAVSDTNTYYVCGAKVTDMIGEKLFSETVLGSPEKRLVPNENTLAQLKANSIGADIIVGAGSGVINDVCKYTAFTLGIPYIIVCTAPSMDGYASSGAALTLNGMKVTLPAKEPYAIIGDTGILRSAPMDMIRAGYGDIIGKFSCLCDWKLSHIVNGEYFCPYVYDMTLESAKKISLSAEKLISRDPGAIEALTKALIEVGIGMSYIGNSRSASGSEHHFSHFFEITGLLEDRECLLHGLDVGYSTLCVQIMREKIKSLPPDYVPKTMNAPERIRRTEDIYGGLAPSVLALQEKTGLYSQDRSVSYRGKWEKILSVLSEAPTVTETEKLLTRAGFDIPAFYSFYGAKKLSDAGLFAKDLKDRYTVLWLYWDLFSGIPERSDPV